MNIAAIIQARMGSTRLPGKVLLDLQGEPMLARVVDRTRRAKTIAGVCVATSTLDADDPIAALCAERGWDCFRGSEQDVLDRYMQAARGLAAEAVVRITADCPLIDPEVLDSVVTRFVSSQGALDYVCNFHPRRTFPRGLDAEIVSAAVLERCGREAVDAPSREHVTAFVYQHPELFHLGCVESAEDHSQYRWTVDTPEDFALISSIYSFFGDDRFSWREALREMERHPAWTDLNRDIVQKAL